MIKVLVVDDHELVRTGFRRILESSDEFEVAGEASNGEDALKLVASLSPSVVLMDVLMPGMGGIAATGHISRTFPDTKVIALSVQFASPFPSQMSEAGALGYLTKGCSAEELFEAIRTVNRGQPYIATELARSLSMAILSGKEESALFLDLTQRELQVLMRIVQGVKTQDIADDLFLSPKTVSTYRYRLYGKLGVKTDVDLTHLAIRHGMLGGSPD